jgi:hypothetical protein
MIITLTPYQEKAIRQAIEAGLVRSVDEFIDTAIDALPHPAGGFDKERASAAVARIREIRKGVRLGLRECRSESSRTAVTSIDAGVRPRRVGVHALGLRRVGVSILSRRASNRPPLGHSQGLNISTPRLSKSFTLRVTSVKSCTSAVAAINPSATATCLPFCRCSPESTPQRSAIASSTGKMRPESQGRSVCSSHSSRSSLRVPAGRMVMPFMDFSPGDHTEIE